MGRARAARLAAIHAQPRPDRESRQRPARRAAGGRRAGTPLQYTLTRPKMVKAGTVAPAVTPMVRVPVNGIEKSQWHAKQALDIGCYGIVWPHISTDRKSTRLNSSHVA